MGRQLSRLLYYKNLLICVFTPIILLPLPIAVKGQEALCGYLLLLMGVYWCTEALPLGVTSLIPVFLAPLFGIMTTKEVCPVYFKDINMMLTGGLIVALAIEKCNLHRRIALRVLLTIGTSPRWLILGFMIPTWFLSMWISNTATSAMMMPIVTEVISQMEDIDEDQRKGAREGAEMDVIQSHLENHGAELSDQTTDLPNQTSTSMVVTPGPNGDVVDVTIRPGDGAMPVEHPSDTCSWDVNGEDDISEGHAKSSSSLAKALVISIAFSANVGGTATLIGTGVNLVVQGQADALWMERLGRESPINFTSWIVYGMPISTLNLVVVWLWLELWFVGPRELFGCGAKKVPSKVEAVKKVVRLEYEKLGRVTTAEIQVGLLFLLLVMLWFFRSPGFIPGWATLSVFKNGYIGDAVPAILIGVILFAIPAAYARYPCNGERPTNLMDWSMMTQKFPWSVILLLGGGFALAESTMRSGLSAWVGDKLTVFQALPEWVMVMVLTYMVTLVTQFTSNTATASLMLPIVSSMAEQLGKNPLYLMLPVTVGTQFAFMLPVATPPNAVAFTSGYITVMDMVTSGFILNILCTLVATLATQTWGMAYFDLNTLPWQSNHSSVTP